MTSPKNWEPKVRPFNKSLTAKMHFHCLQLQIHIASAACSDVPKLGSENCEENPLLLLSGRLVGPISIGQEFQHAFLSISTKTYRT